MNLFKLLFSSDIGLLSAFTIAFIIGMAIYFAWFFAKKIREEEAAKR